MVELCGALDAEYGLPALRFELQVETPQAILGADGTVLVARMIHAAAGRCAGLHFGTYDYSASVEIAAAYQSMEQPAADYAKAVMSPTASTNVLPVGDTKHVRATSTGLGCPMRQAGCGPIASGAASVCWTSWRRRQRWLDTSRRGAPS